MTAVTASCDFNHSFEEGRFCDQKSRSLPMGRVTRTAFMTAKRSNQFLSDCAGNRRKQPKGGESGLSGTAPQASDRFPWMKLKFSSGEPVEDVFQKLDDLHFNLLVFSQAAPSEQLPGIPDLLRMHIVPRNAFNDAELARLKIPQPSFYFVRPDGYISSAARSCWPAQWRTISPRNCMLNPCFEFIPLRRVDKG
jgi:hypothetical protein